MAYATESEYSTAFGADHVETASDFDGDGSPDSGAVDAALDEATSKIDSKIKGRYAVPLETVPDIVRRCCIEIADYLLSKDMGPYTKEKRQRYEDWCSWLDAIKRGDDEIEGIAQKSGANVSYKTAARVMKRENFW